MNRFSSARHEQFIEAPYRRDKRSPRSNHHVSTGILPHQSSLSPSTQKEIAMGLLIILIALILAFVMSLPFLMVIAIWRAASIADSRSHVVVPARRVVDSRSPDMKTPQYPSRAEDALEAADLV